MNYTVHINNGDTISHLNGYKTNYLKSEYPRKIGINWGSASQGLLEKTQTAKLHFHR
jgi:hypothetical protein